MVRGANLGFPRIGPNRELKFATEKYWQHELDQAALEHTAQALRAANWRVQRDLGLAVIPSNDFSLYDHVLDMTALVGAVPARFGWQGGAVDLDTYFALARGRPETPAMEMTKWFDTNYHYIVPEFTPEQRFVLATDKPVREFREAQALGIHTRPVLLGPVTYLLLGKAKGARFDPLLLLDRLLPVYETLLAQLAAAGADWVQLDEPCLALDLSEAARAAYSTAYQRLGRATALQIMLTTYFAAVDEPGATVAGLPVAGLHIDLVRAPAQLEAVLAALGDEQVLSLGLIDGRNVWRADLDSALALVQQAQTRIGRARLQVAPSCSLLHCPLDLDREQQLDPDLKRWLAFAVQKLQEVTLIAQAANGARDLAAWADACQALASRSSSPRVHHAAVQQRVAALTPTMRQRAPAHERRQAQAQALALPLFPTTTIGSFPQTADVRRRRAAFRQGALAAPAYEQFLQAQIADAVRWQEAIGLDVLVHGEFERNDMVEYFGERLAGFAFTAHGWVQSYGSRYVKPPIIFGDVWRPQPMTVSWLAYAQSLTPRPVKGMLTGPVTMLHWSFVRDDQPLANTACQIALALRDEVQDLEAAGLRILQIDEPALREGLPLRAADRAAYLDWAVDAFRLCTAGVQPATQIQTHMCYAEFSDILEAIAALDADVLSIETARSDMELLDAFTAYHYPNPIGPGVYDIHSPRIPSVDEMVTLLRKAAQVLAPEQVWVNPDCGLKTRRWEEVRPALGAMVQAAHTLRQEYARTRAPRRPA